MTGRSSIPCLGLCGVTQSYRAASMDWPPVRGGGRAALNSIDEPSGCPTHDSAGFYGSALYNEIWRPQGFHTRMEAVLRGRRGQFLGSLVLYRSERNPRFTLGDERHLAAVLPVFSAALEACGAPVAHDHHVRSPDPPEALLMTLDDEVEHASDDALQLLLLAEGGVSRQAPSQPINALAGRLLPLLLRRLRQRAARGVEAVLDPPPSVSHENAFGQFVASGQLLRSRQAVGSRWVGEVSVQPTPRLAPITLTRLEPHRVALERALRSLPITAGQMAVCRERYRGASHRDIAQRLGVTQTTVTDHVRKACNRLDLRSRLSCGRWWMRA